MPPPPKILKSPVGKIKLGEAYFTHKGKDNDESVSVYNGKLGKLERRDVIVKVFHLSGSRTVSKRAAKEIDALKHLTERQCGYAPTYITDFKESYVAGVEHYVVMTKCPGYSLDNRDLWGNKLFTQVQKAFEVAIEAVHDCGVDNGSHMDRNVVFDPKEKKCYIIDFERAEWPDGEEYYEPVINERKNFGFWMS